MYDSSSTAEANDYVVTVIATYTNVDTSQVSGQFSYTVTFIDPCSSTVISLSVNDMTAMVEQGSVESSLVLSNTEDHSNSGFCGDYTINLLTVLTPPL